MDDLISRQAAIDALDEIEAEVADGYGYQYAKWREYFVEMPSAQPEPSQTARDIATIIENEQDMRVIERNDIVRCKDCKHKGTRNCVANTWAAIFEFGVKDDFYCGLAEMAERRTDR